MNIHTNMNNIANVGQLLNSLNQVIFSLRNEVEAVRNDVLSLKSAISAAKVERLSNNDATLNELSQHVATLDKEVAAIKLIQESISMATNNFQPVASSLSDRISVLEKVPSPTVSPLVTPHEVQAMIDKSLALLLTDTTPSGPDVSCNNSNNPMFDEACADIAIVEVPQESVETDNNETLSATDSSIAVAKPTRGRGRGRGKKTNT